MSTVSVKDLYKIYGSRPERVFPLLEKGLSKEEILQKTGNTIGINNVSFTVKSGEVFVIMGLSGSGKSTLIRCINRLIDPTKGQVSINDKEITSMDSEELRNIRQKQLGMVFQHFALFPHRSIVKNVEYGLEVRGIGEEERNKKAMQALEQVGLKEYAENKPSELSGGMQQRVGLARALAIDPEILLMDEPFSALDPLIRREMQDELLELQSDLNKTIIFITHDLDEALRIGDRIAIMKEGHFAQVGTPEEILSDPADDYVAEFVQDVNRLKILKAEDAMFRPDALVDVNDGPRMALRIMEKEGFSNIYVVDEKRKVAGVVSDERAIQAIKNDEKDITKILDTDFHKVHRETPLAELLTIASTTSYPIAVVDDRERLVGLIVRVSVLASLAEGSDDNG